MNMSRLPAVIAVALLAGAAMTGSTASAAVTPAPSAPTTAAGFTAAFQAKSDHDWAGGDQVTSVAAMGRTYWLFGDTMRGGTDTVGATMVANSILVQDGGTFVNALADGSQPAVPGPASVPGDKYWIQGAVPMGAFLWVVAQRAHPDPTDGLGFKLAGVDLFRFTVRMDGKLTNMVGPYSTPSPSGTIAGRGTGSIQWSGDVIANGGYLYVYGFTVAEEGNAFVDHWSYVARVVRPYPDGSRWGPWRFFKRSTGTWVDSPAGLDAGPNGPDSIVDAQVSSVRVIGGKVVMAYKPWLGFGDTVKVATADTPAGPFTVRASLPSPAGVSGNGAPYVTYSPQLHPEQVLSGVDSGRVLLSEAWNGSTFADVLADANLYKPRFRTVSVL